MLEKCNLINIPIFSHNFEESISYRILGQQLLINLKLIVHFGTVNENSIAQAQRRTSSSIGVVDKKAASNRPTNQLH